jgi:hypothetical protein
MADNEAPAKEGLKASTVIRMWSGGEKQKARDAFHGLPGGRAKAEVLKACPGINRPAE